MRALALVSAAVVSAVAVPANALEPTLSPAAVSDAVAAGRAMANSRGGYAVAPYLLFTVSDAVLITDDDANVEAVQLGTPYERLRFEAYREQVMRTPFNAGDIAAFDEQHAGRIDFIVYTHSRTEKDRAFLDKFGGGALVQTDGTTLADAEISRSRPVTDTYTKPGGAVVSRYLGQVTYRFALAGNAAAQAMLGTPLTFTFSDDRGVVHRVAVTLGNYR